MRFAAGVRTVHPLGRRVPLETETPELADIKEQPPFQNSRSFAFPHPAAGLELAGSVPEPGTKSVTAGDGNSAPFVDVQQVGACSLRCDLGADNKSACDYSRWVTIERTRVAGNGNARCRARTTADGGF